MDFVDKSATVAATLAFQESAEVGWEKYCNLSSWTEREEVVEYLENNLGRGAWKAFSEMYKSKMDRFIRKDFYIVVENEIEKYAQLYQTTGAIDVPFLKEDCLEDISKWSIGVEAEGNNRYGKTRTVYPPGEVKSYEVSDPRKGLYTQVNMVAVAARHMQMDDVVQWIYHSPHLKMFIKGVMRFAEMYPYLNDLGVAVNVMRPFDNAKTALGKDYYT